MRAVALGLMDATEILPPHYYNVSSCDLLVRNCNLLDNFSQITTVITEPEPVIIHFKTRASPASRASHCYPTM